MAQKHFNFGKPCKIQIGGNPTAYPAGAICAGGAAGPSNGFEDAAKRRSSAPGYRLSQNGAPEAAGKIPIVGTPFYANSSVRSLGRARGAQRNVDDIPRLDIEINGCGDPVPLLADLPDDGDLRPKIACLDRHRSRAAQRLQFLAQRLHFDPQVRHVNVRILQLAQQIDGSLARQPFDLPQEILTLTLQPHQLDGGLQAAGRRQQKGAAALRHARACQ
jgi:hypothetical protein